MPTNAVVLLDEAQCQELESFLVERIYEFNSGVTGFYEHLGYERKYAIEGRPKGYADIVYIKLLQS